MVKGNSNVLLWEVIKYLLLPAGGGVIWRFYNWWKRVEVDCQLTQGWDSLFGYIDQKAKQQILNGIDIYITNNTKESIRISTVHLEFRSRRLPLFPPKCKLIVNLEKPIQNTEIPSHGSLTANFSNEDLLEKVAIPIDEQEKQRRALYFSLPQWCRIVVWHSKGKATSKFFPTLRIKSYFQDLATKREYFMARKIYESMKTKNAPYEELFSQIKKFTKSSERTAMILMFLIEDDLKNHRKVPRQWREKLGEMRKMYAKYIKGKPLEAFSTMYY